LDYLFFAWETMTKILLYITVFNVIGTAIAWTWMPPPPRYALVITPGERGWEAHKVRLEGR
jgi:hypothetical protein